ncbi:hypothetical protein M413DRAFT_33101 [Hebeloma cylindrosporum]|uniref:Hydrophobin n=1 Tax=Hebeloma cylindrosporum TaxID=76867 RepID=A0A0C3BCZ3_HEBCY|nr:hypothetical protein M413DRAFT_33101 [Hebeloma cylindrosporum h7]
MFAKSFVAIAIALVLPALVNGAGVPDRNNDITNTKRSDKGDSFEFNECNSGPIQCCDSIQTADSHEVIQLLALTGAITEAPDTLVGMTCSPMTTLGAGAGSTCSSQPVCCEDNSFNGVIAVGCTPINM